MRNNKLSLVLLLILVVGCGPSDEKKGYEGKLDRINLLLSQQFDAGGFNGNVLIALPDTIYSRSLGLSRSIGKIPLETKSVFYLGSLAKQFTALSIMILAEEGKLNYDDPVSNYIDSLPKICEQITIRHMLNHTSGLPDYYNMGIFVSGMTNQMVLKAMKHIDSLNFKPGTRYEYSNSAYVLLSILTENVSGMSFREFLKNRIFEPLGMVNSFVFDQTRPGIPFRALGHNRDGSVNDYNAYTTGGGGIFSTIYDLNIWVKALDDYRLVSSRTMELAYTPAQLNDTLYSYYGFGWRLEKDNPSIVQHSGSLAGYRTYLYRDRKEQLVIVLLSNFSDDVSNLNSDIVAILNE